jgi:exonuclease VII large subunit
MRAATPSDAARRLVPDKSQFLTAIATQQQTFYQAISKLMTQIEAKIDRVNHSFSQLYHQLGANLERLSAQNYHSIEQLIRL